jgi:predicted outer membrane repeat protein
MATIKFSRTVFLALALMLAMAALASVSAQSAAPTLPPCSGSPTYLVADGVTATWSTAYSTDLQATIDLAAADYLSKAYSNCVEWVWVAKGTYKPAASDRSASFQPKEGVGVYGGFAGSETSLSQRDWVANPTILSGDLLGDDGPYYASNADNSYHVVNVGRQVGYASAILDGFIITGGNANGSNPNNSGGGIYNYNEGPILANLKISNNYAKVNGGGMYDAVGVSTMTNITFTGNFAGQNGGGMYLAEDQPILNNALFYNNQANNGAAMYLTGSAHPTLTNATFSNNTAFVHGSALYIDDTSYPTLQNSILWGDQINPDLTDQQAGSLEPHTLGEEIYILPTVPPSPPVTVTSSLVYGCNPTSQWNAACGTDGGGNLADADPRFLNATLGDLHLRANSPAIDRGSNALSSGIDSDLDGAPRLMGSAVDLGAYEHSKIIYVDANAAGALHDGAAWATAFTSLQSALAAAQPYNEIWVARGTYKPTTNPDQNASFVLKDNLGVYGGLLGNETARQDGDWRANPTILSGDLNGDDGPGLTNISDNSYHVVSSGGAFKATLSSFTISGGNASGATQANGGGMFNLGGRLTLENLVFSANAALSGGGMYNSPGSILSLNNVIFSGNYASGLGGGMFNASSSPRLTNSIFWGNTADRGGGMANNASSPALINVSFNANRALSGAGGGMDSSNNSTPFIANTILWGDAPSEISSGATSTPVISYSLVQGCKPANWNSACGADGGHNLADVDPNFVNAVHGDLHLRVNSPAINHGGNAFVFNIATDLDGQPRKMGSAVDLGTYEQPTIYYVNVATTNTIQDCLSWATACTDLQGIMSDVSPRDEIWVARGVYQTYDDRTDSFTLGKGVAVYGGFSGFETARVDRNWRTNTTILSGDLGAFGNNTDNNYHVVLAGSVDATSVLDGFTITGGNANGSASPDDTGGGMLILGGSPTLANLTFKDNNAKSGAGLYSSGGSPALTNATFQGNAATTDGSGFYNLNGAPALTNTVFIHNSAGQRGGGLFISDALNQSPAFTNLSFSANTAAAGGAIYNSGSSSIVQNSILWGDSSGEIANSPAHPAARLTLRYSLAAGCKSSSNNWNSACGVDGGHNLVDVDPQYIDPPHNNLRLVYSSQAIDQGNNLYVSGVSTDLDNKPRILGLAVDLGAYEFPNAIYVPMVIK